jgi:lipopolysaccharide transport system permease protein
MSPETLVIRPPQKRIGLELRDVWEHRGLVYFFVWRDIKVRYKQSIFGVGWAVIQPLLMMAAFTLFFGNLAAISTDGIPRPIFYYAAILLLCGHPSLGVFLKRRHPGVELNTCE